MFTITLQILKYNSLVILLCINCVVIRTKEIQVCAFVIQLISPTYITFGSSKQQAVSRPSTLLPNKTVAARPQIYYCCCCKCRTNEKSKVTSHIQSITDLAPEVFREQQQLIRAAQTQLLNEKTTKPDIGGVFQDVACQQSDRRSSLAER